MLKISPQHYKSAPELLDQLGEYLEPLGERALVVGDKSALEDYEDTIRSALKDSMMGVTFEVCLGVCCLTEVERLVDVIEEEEADIIVGLGGGTTMDVAKYAGQMSDSKVATLPTVVSSCAGFTNLVHLYSEDGDFIKRVKLDSCPQLLLLDHRAAGLTDSNYLAAGVANSCAARFLGEQPDSFLPREISKKLAVDLRQRLFEEARKAMADVKKGKVSERLRRVEEGVVLEGGLVHTLADNPPAGVVARLLAHQIAPLATSVDLFGETVAFTSLVQEKLFETGEFGRFHKFYRELGLPVKLDDLGLPENQRDTIVHEAVEEVYSRLPEEGLEPSFSREQIIAAVNGVQQKVSAPEIAESG